MLIVVYIVIDLESLCWQWQICCFLNHQQELVIHIQTLLQICILLVMQEQVILESGYCEFAAEDSYAFLVNSFERFP
ncbi:hypothetical protein Hanom_Chr07g00625781 [Helianthus anomalus]